MFFVIQMSGVRYFTPNTDTHPEFKEALKEAAEAGVHVVAYDCSVREDEIRIQDPVPVILENPELYELSQVLVPWYQKARRSSMASHHRPISNLGFRNNASADTSRSSKALLCKVHGSTSECKCSGKC